MNFFLLKIFFCFKCRIFNRVVCDFRDTIERRREIERVNIFTILSTMQFFNDNEARICEREEKRSFHIFLYYFLMKNAISF